MAHTTNTIEKAAGAINTNGQHTDTNGADFRTQELDSKALNTESAELALVSTKVETRVDSRLLAQHLGNKHKAVFELLIKHKDDFLLLGKVPFQTEALPSGQREKFGLLNEDQSLLMLTFSRNTVAVRALKVKLVKAFSAARKARDLHGTEYLPVYHELHDALHELASGSEHERQVHMNFNKLVNKAAGIAAGQRTGLNLPTQSMLIVAQLMALQAVRAAPGHKEAYQLSKAAVAPLLALGGAMPMLEVGTHGPH